MVQEVFGDIKLAVMSCSIIAVYLVLFLGSVSPLHSRVIVGFCGVLCVAVSLAAGYGICFSSGWLATEATQVLPPMMLGIGVDDMFVICNSVDQ